MKKFILVLLISSTVNALAGKIMSAYKALSIYDYFKAKELFYSSLTKNPCEASYGLATIYYRTDNPFSNIDSAAKYIAKSNLSFKDTVTLSSYFISRTTINSLLYSIGDKGFKTYSATLNTVDLNHFLQRFYFTNDTLLNAALLVRDELYFARYKATSSSDSMRLFLLDHPQTALYLKAKDVFYNFQYAEHTTQGTAFEYKQFIKLYSGNPNVIKAEHKLYELTKQLHSPDSLYSFINSYSKYTIDDAWKLLYSISVKNYSKHELNEFLDKYPGYPYRDDIEKEISLSQQIQFPLKNNKDKYGYIDTLGNWVIKPSFDDAAPFKEGFAGVCKNDSCFFINKEGMQTSRLYFEETEDYSNGLAIVKRQGEYYLINRSGQLITKGFEDINNASDNLFVCKQNGLYGAINTKAETVIPFTYRKLGNFKNGYAYYLSDKYGLVDVYNNALKAQWDWISEIDTNNLVIVKKEMKFGLMSLDETVLLNPEFDYISYCENGIYLIVKKDLYGFYNAIEKCYITAIVYDYDKTFNNDYYTNGRQLKLIEEEEVALADMNGRMSIGFGTYTNVFFAKNDMIRIKKGKKFGYVDRKLNRVTPADFDEATDFENSTAIVTKQNISQLLNKAGKPLFTIKDGTIERDEPGFFQISFNNLFGLVNNRGEVLLPTEYSSIKYISHNLWSCTKNNELFVYKANCKSLLKVTD